LDHKPDKEQNKSTGLTMKKYVFFLILLFNSTYIHANASSDKVLSFAIVPQQSATKLAQLWTPIINHLSEQSGLVIRFTTAPDIPTFEKRLAAGEYDIAYMNPYHYVTFNQSVGYQALAKASNKKIKGIIVTAKNSNIKNLQALQDATLAFPAPGAFAATILTQAELNTQQVNFTAKYVSSHDSVYLSVAKGIYPAGGGIMRTFNNITPEIHDQLNILWETQGYTPHAIATHPSMNIEDNNRLQQALVAMKDQPLSKALLNNINISGFISAVDADWDDIRALNIK
jgi:phosphonate transport system substrate-binding protein